MCGIELQQRFDFSDKGSTKGNPLCFSKWTKGFGSPGKSLGLTMPNPFLPVFVLVILRFYLLLLSFLSFFIFGLGLNLNLIMGLCSLSLFFLFWTSLPAEGSIWSALSALSALPLSALSALPLFGGFFSCTTAAFGGGTSFGISGISFPTTVSVGTSSWSCLSSPAFLPLPLPFPFPFRPLPLPLGLLPSFPSTPGAVSQSCTPNWLRRRTSRGSKGKELEWRWHNKFNQR